MWCSFANNLCFNSDHILIFWAILSWAPSVCAMWISYWLRLVMVLWLATDGAATKPRASCGRTHMVQRSITRLYRCAIFCGHSQNDRCILSQYVAIFCPNLSSVSRQNTISWMCIYLSPGSYMLLHPWRSSFESRDEILLRGEGCDTPGVNFALCREIYPNLGCSVKISISHSRMSLIIQIIYSHFTKFGIIQSQEQPNLELLKLLFSARM
jgi:hypothetical protein